MPLRPAIGELSAKISILKQKPKHLAGVERARKALGPKQIVCHTAVDPCNIELFMRQCACIVAPGTVAVQERMKGFRCKNCNACKVAGLAFALFIVNVVTKLEPAWFLYITVAHSCLPETILEKPSDEAIMPCIRTCAMLY